MSRPKTQTQKTKKAIHVTSFGKEVLEELSKRGPNAKREMAITLGMSEDAIKDIKNKSQATKTKVDKICTYLGWDRAEHHITDDIYNMLDDRRDRIKAETIKESVNEAAEEIEETLDDKFVPTKADIAIRRLNNKADYDLAMFNYYSNELIADLYELAAMEGEPND